MRTAIDAAVHRTLPSVAAVLLAAASAAGLAGCSSMPGSVSRQVVKSDGAPAAIGPYSQGIRVGSTLYLAGQGAIDPASGQAMASASIEDQTRRVMDNLKAVLAASGMSMNDVVSTTVFLTDIGDFTKMNSVYATYFQDAPPARATVGVSTLPRNLKVQISAIAVHP